MSRFCFLNKKKTIKGKIVSNSKKRNIRCFFPNIKKIKIKNFNFYFRISTKSFKKIFKNV